MASRIEWIEAKYLKRPNLYVPFFISLIYILLVPYFNLGIDFLLSIYSKKRSKEKKENRISDLEQQAEEAELERKISEAKAAQA